MKQDKINTCICRGFNGNFDIPLIGDGSRAKFRTAVVLKKINHNDDWEVYDGLFWRIVQKVSDRLSAELEIRCAVSGLESVESLLQWRKLQAEYPEEGIDTPVEINFVRGEKPVCVMKHEDWSDVGKIEPYAISYTYSFYSLNSAIDNAIAESIRVRLLESEEVGKVEKCVERSAPKWYWSIVNSVDSTSLFIYISLGLMAVAFIVIGFLL